MIDNPQMMIEAKQVSLFKGQASLLKDISWQVKPGEHWAILGLNGSGKTSLLNMINGYDWPSRGSLRVLDQAFGSYDLRELRKSLGWVSSALESRLYGQETVEDIVISGRFASVGLYDRVGEEDRQAAKVVLEQMKISSFRRRPLETLSQGEKQRVMIGRALMANPQILILDEPCNGLDLFAREELLKTIRGLAEEKRGMSIIYVTHHTDEILPLFDQALLLRRGQVHSSGERARVMTEDNLQDFFERDIHCRIEEGRIMVRPKDRA